MPNGIGMRQEVNRDWMSARQVQIVVQPVCLQGVS